MKKEIKVAIEPGAIAQKIFVIRKQKVMLDFHLAEMYQVTTGQLNQQVKRNIDRFPTDFMFKLSKEEKKEVITICDNLGYIKYSPNLPYAFTEHGVAMLSSVLRSPRAVQMNIFIIRAFVKMRELIATHKDLAKRIDQIEKKQEEHSDHLAVVSDVLKKLMDSHRNLPNAIGFQADSE